MVDTRQTPDYKGGKKGGQVKPIPTRPLSDLEFEKLEELLPIAYTDRTSPQRLQHRMQACMAADGETYGDLAG